MVTIAHTCLEGLKADGVTDLIQGILLIAGIGFVFLSVCKTTGGFTESSSSMTRLRTP
jgi:Na+/pantothenate symporter